MPSLHSAMAMSKRQAAARLPARPLGGAQRSRAKESATCAAERSEANKGARWQPRRFFNTVVRRASRLGGPASAGPPTLRRANHCSEEMRDEAPRRSRFAASFELVRFCPHCGTPVTPGARFCTECGENLAAFAPVAELPLGAGGAVAPPAPSGTARRATPTAGIEENRHVIAPFALVFFAILAAGVAVA